jgi:hypothetical protein
MAQQAAQSRADIRIQRHTGENGAVFFTAEVQNAFEQEWKAWATEALASGARR